jgi:uncharacterized surface protein with fasciclin (FAS1) repeats
MKKYIIVLAIVLGLFVSAQSASASSMHMLTPSSAQEILVSQGYFTLESSHREMRMGIMKFQRENGLRETGTLNVHTRKALKKIQNMPNIVETAVATPILSTLVAAVKAGGLVDTLVWPGPFTVFAPTNDAFAKIPSATLAALLTPEKKPDLVKILTFHVVSGKALSTDLYDGQEITTVQGGKLKVKIMNGKVYINGAQVVLADVKTKNGVVHVIDSVLMP